MERRNIEFSTGEPSVSNKECRMTKGGRRKAFQLIIGEDISNFRFQILFEGVEKSMNSSKDFP